MKIAVKGQVNQVEELKNLISEHSLISFKISEIDTYDVIFDLDFDDSPEQIEIYHQAKGKLIIVGSVKIQLEELYAELGSYPSCTIVGMNTLPTLSTERSSNVVLLMTRIKLLQVIFSIN